VKKLCNVAQESTMNSDEHWVTPRNILEAQIVDPTAQGSVRVGRSAAERRRAEHVNHGNLAYSARASLRTRRSGSAFSHSENRSL
jgi:hypothetical protein